MIYFTQADNSAPEIGDKLKEEGFMAWQPMGLSVCFKQTAAPPLCSPEHNRLEMSPSNHQSCG